MRASPVGDREGNGSNGLESKVRENSQRSPRRERAHPFTYRKSSHKYGTHSRDSNGRGSRHRERSSRSPTPVSRHPHAYFGDDLLRAERFEARLAEEKEWSAKLDGIQHDDHRDALLASGSNEDAAWEEEMRRMRGDTDAKLAESRIPRRSVPIDAPHVSAQLSYLTDEEYAAYMRDGMHRRKNAASIAFEEERQRKWDEEQQRRWAAGEQKREYRKKERRRREIEIEKTSVAAARHEWDAAWTDSSSDKKAWTLATVPWPIVQEGRKLRVKSRIPLSKDAVRFFLFAHDTDSEGTLRLRSALLRFHPDRFLSSQHFAQIEHTDDKDAIRRNILTVSQILSEIVGDRRA